VKAVGLCEVVKKRRRLHVSLLRDGMCKEISAVVWLPVKNRGPGKERRESEAGGEWSRISRISTFNLLMF
jgi:hypothetical protein